MSRWVLQGICASLAAMASAAALVLVVAVQPSAATPMGPIVPVLTRISVDPAANYAGQAVYSLENHGTGTMLYKGYAHGSALVRVQRQDARGDWIDHKAEGSCGFGMGTQALPPGQSVLVHTALQPGTWRYVVDVRAAGERATGFAALRTQKAISAAVTVPQVPH